MARTVDSRITTPGAELRDLLDRAERQLPGLQAADLGDYLARLDRLDELFVDLTREAADLRPEQTRWDDLQARLAARAASLTRLAAAVGGFAALRAANPPATGAWWHLDEMAAANQRSSWKRLAIGAGIAVAVLAVLAFAYQRWFAPDPAVIAAVSAVNDVEQLVLNQDWDQAQATTLAALERMPDNPDLLLWAGILAEHNGDPAGSAGYFDRAQQAIADPLRYNLMLGMKRLMASDADGAAEAAQAAQQINPNEPQALFLLANVAELRGDTAKALELYDQTALLADTTNPQLVVMSKMRYGMLLQQLSAGLTTPGAEPTGAEPPGTPTPGP